MICLLAVKQFSIFTSFDGNCRNSKYKSTKMKLERKTELIQINRVGYVSMHEENVVKYFSNNDRRTVWRSTSSLFLSQSLSSCCVHWINHSIQKSCIIKIELYFISKYLLTAWQTAYNILDTSPCLAAIHFHSRHSMCFQKY